MELEKSPGRVYMSKYDIQGLRESPKLIEVVVGLRKVGKKGEISDNHYLVSGYISGDYGLYRFDLGGYYLDGRIRKAVMQVPEKVLKMVR